MSLWDAGKLWCIFFSCLVSVVVTIRLWFDEVSVLKLFQCFAFIHIKNNVRTTNICNLVEKMWIWTVFGKGTNRSILGKEHKMLLSLTKEIDTRIVFTFRICSMQVKAH